MLTARTKSDERGLIPVGIILAIFLAAGLSGIVKGAAHPLWVLVARGTQFVLREHFPSTLGIGDAQFSGMFVVLCVVPGLVVTVVSLWIGVRIYNDRPQTKAPAERGLGGN